MIQKIIHTLSVCLICFSLAAQYTDSLPHPEINSHSATAKKKSPYKSYLLPASLIVYGIVSRHTDALQDVNETVNRELSPVGSHHKTTIDNYLQYSPAAAVYALNLAGVHGLNNFRDRTIIYGLSNLMLGITVAGLKKITSETRPDGSDNLSFPSGHTTTAFAAAEFMRMEYKNHSPLYGIGGYAAAIVTAYLRLYNNKHWIGDVAAGAGVGILSTKLAYWMYPAIKKKLFKDKTINAFIIPTFQDGAPGLAFTRYF